MATKIIKCPKCNTFNKDRYFCENCGYLLSQKVKQIRKENEVMQTEIKKAIYKRENPGFVERLKKHHFFLYRAFGWILYSITMVISIIGAGLAWLIAMVAAG